MSNRKASACSASPAVSPAPELSVREHLALEIFYRLIDSPNYIAKRNGVARIAFDRADQFLAEMQDQRHTDNA